MDFFFREKNTLALYKGKNHIGLTHFERVTETKRINDDLDMKSSKEHGAPKLQIHISNKYI